MPSLLRHPLVRRVLRSPWTWGVVGALVTGATVVGLFGGWQRASVEDVVELPAGEPVDLGAFEVTVHSWDVIERPEYMGGDDHWYLALLITVTSHDTQPYYLGSSDLVPTVATTAGSTVMVEALRVLDLTTAYTLTPGLTQQLVLLFDTGEEDLAPAPGEPLEVLVQGSELREHVLTHDLGWWSSGVAGRLEVPHDDSFLDDLRAADAAAAEDEW